MYHCPGCNSTKVNVKKHNGRGLKSTWYGWACRSCGGGGSASSTHSFRDKSQNRPRASKEDRQEKNRKLREMWQQAKDIAEKEGDEIGAIIAERGLEISPINFAYVLYQMRAKGLDGLPYVDMKTFEGWRKSGFTVMKGEKSTASAITWITPPPKEGEEDEEDRKPSYAWPKEYYLFHRSQVTEYCPK